MTICRALILIQLSVLENTEQSRGDGSRSHSNSSKAALQPSRLGQEKAVLLFAREKVMKRNALGAPFPRVTLV